MTEGGFDKSSKTLRIVIWKMRIEYFFCGHRGQDKAEGAQIVSREI